MRTLQHSARLALTLATLATSACSSSDSAGDPPATQQDASPASDASADGAWDGSAPDGSVGDGASDGTAAVDGTDALVQDCDVDGLICEGSRARMCSEPVGSGTDCAAQGQVCVPGLGCVNCVPHTGTCSETHATWCRSDGSALLEFACDPALGLACQGDECVGPCAPALTEYRYIGCEYFPVTTLNDVNNNYDFEVAVANSSSTEAAVVTVTGGALSNAVTVTVAAGGVERIKLPWVSAVKVCNEDSLGNGFDQINACSAAHNPDYSSIVVTKGAYRLASTRPVAVYQFAPIQAAQSGFQAGTTEASLLVPQTALGRSYRVATYGQGFARGAIAIVATVDDTTITVHPTADVTPGGGNATGIPAGGKGTYQANRGDVVELISAANSESQNVGDLTGTEIEADHPIAVMGVHGCAHVISQQSCDHLEDSMFPTGALGTSYLLKASTYAGSVGYVGRIIATQNNTQLTFDPPSVSGPQTLAKPGDVYDVAAADFAVHVMSNKPVLVAGLNQGDNTLALAAPMERYLNDYLFYTPEFQNNYVKLFAPAGVTVKLDGVEVPAASFAPIGSSGFGWAVVPVQQGAHRAEAASKFGVMVYGNQAAGYVAGGLPSAYEYPGGLDLHLSN